MSYQFASFLEAYPEEAKRKGRLRFSKELNYKWLCMIHKRNINEIVDYINQNESLVDYAKSKKEFPRALLKDYVSKGKSAHLRVRAMMADLNFATQHLPDTSDKSELILASIQDRFTIKLKINHLNCVEGVLQLGIYEGNKRLYIVSFSLGYENLLIGSIQGANDEMSKKLIKLATKAMFGLRPQQLMIWLMLELADILQFDKVEAISIDNHPLMKRRYKRKNKQLFIADYQQIWSSYNGKRLPNVNWEIPPMTLKSLEEVASKKRSMYRKRYAMLDDIRDSMMSALHHDYPSKIQSCT